MWDRSGLPHGTLQETYVSSQRSPRCADTSAARPWLRLRSELGHREPDKVSAFAGLLWHEITQEVSAVPALSHEHFPAVSVLDAALNNGIRCTSGDTKHMERFAATRA